MLPRFPALFLPVITMTAIMHDVGQAVGISLNAFY